MRITIINIFLLATLSGFISGCNNQDQQENKNTYSAPQSIKNQLTNGVTYRYLEYLSCADSEKIKCFDNNKYEELCKSSEGFTKWAATGTASFDHVGRYLIENGQLEDYRIEWIESGKICKLNVTFSGIYNGSSTRKNLWAYVYGFILNDQGKLLAHDTSSL